MPIVVKKKKGDSKNDVIGKFRRIFLEEEIVEEVKKRLVYNKPSMKRYARKKINIWRKKCRKRSKKRRTND